MPFTPEEVERIYYHLGYQSTVPNAASIQLGMPVLTQTNFLLGRAISLLSIYSENRVRRYLNIMDGIENQLVTAQGRLRAEKLDELVLRQEEPELLEREYVRWGLRIAGIFSVAPYAYSERYREHLGAGLAGRAGTIPVRG